MSFWIQASNPRFTGVLDPHDETLGDAIETAFPLETECALLVWRHIYIPLSYKYDVSVIMSDLLTLLPRLLREEAGTAEVQWPSNTFCAHWQLQWSAEVLTVEATWTSVVGDLESRLNETGPIRVGPRQFGAEWKQVLGTVWNALQHSGHSGARLPDMDELHRLYMEIPGAGSLYR